MYKKICTRCSRSSFSSSESGEWVCPSCGNQLTASPLYRSTLKPQNLYPLRKKLEAYQKQQKRYL
ncbi:TFIIB-type zinc finger domain-containing protein [Bacillus sp. KH172YL63]|uniref:TFIIB-type zinc finger domain-containing protein n=1 Tax=Bacillus sp. KH172YL63 TaxID=2709784 RepID=UPI003FA47346